MKWVVLFILTAITFAIEKLFDISLPAWVYVFILFFLAKFIIENLIKESIKGETLLLEGLSDDINEIKKKLGLKVEARTRSQIDEINRSLIHRVVLEGKSLKDLKEYFGSAFYREYKWYMESCLKDYPDRRICPKCKKLYGKYADNCDGECNYTRLVEFKNYKEDHPKEKGWVDDG